MEELTKAIRYALYGLGIIVIGFFLYISFHAFMGWYFRKNSPEVKTDTLPYTLEFDSMRVTFESVSLPDRDKVLILSKYTNLLHESNSNYYLPGRLKLKTDRNNLYEIKGDRPDTYFKPEEERQVVGYSRINPEEKPVALVYYKEIWGEYLPILELQVEIEHLIEEKTPTIANLPYSWTEGDIMITIHEVFLANSNTREGWIAEGYKQYKVRISYRNLAHRTLDAKASVGDLRLMTNRGNLYDPRYVGGSSCYGRLDPEYSYNTHNYAFNIRREEEPTELWKYKDKRKDKQPIMIFSSLH